MWRRGQQLGQFVEDLGAPSSLQLNAVEVGEAGLALLEEGADLVELFERAGEERMPVVGMGIRTAFEAPVAVGKVEIEGRDGIFEVP